MMTYDIHEVKTSSLAIPGGQSGRFMLTTDSVTAVTESVRQNHRMQQQNHRM